MSKKIDKKVKKIVYEMWCYDFNVNEIFEETGVSKSTIYRMIKEFKTWC